MDGFFMIIKAKYHVYGMAGGGKPHPAGAVFFDDFFKRVCLFWHTLMKITFRTDD